MKDGGQNRGSDAASEVLLVNPFCFIPNSAQDPHSLKVDMGKSKCGRRIRESSIDFA